MSILEAVQEVGREGGVEGVFGEGMEEQCQHIIQTHTLANTHMHHTYTLSHILHLSMLPSPPH